MGLFQIGFARGIGFRQVDKKNRHCGHEDQAMKSLRGVVNLGKTKKGV